MCSHCGIEVDTDIDVDSEDDMIRDIEVVHRWAYCCRECGVDFMGEADSAGQAENLAQHHIDSDIGDENPRPYYDHTVTITPITVVGRNV